MKKIWICMNCSYIHKNRPIYDCCVRCGLLCVEKNKLNIPIPSWLKHPNLLEIWIRIPWLSVSTNLMHRSIDRLMYNYIGLSIHLGPYGCKMGKDGKFYDRGWSFAISIGDDLKHQKSWRDKYQSAFIELEAYKKAFKKFSKTNKINPNELPNSYKD